MKKIFLVFVLVLFTAQFSQAQWEPDVRLTNNPDTSLTSDTERCIAAIDDFVHVVWYDKRDGNWEIYYKRSTDKGITWESDIRLTNNGSDSYSPCIAASGSNIHVVWYDKRDENWEIYYKHSTDEGLSWGTDIRLTDYAGDSRRPSISVSGSVVHVVWHDARDGNYEIYYKHSTDGGLNWETDTRLSDDDDDYSYASDIAASGSNVHVVWMEWRDGNCEIYYKRSTDGGIDWGADTRLTNAIGNSWSPSIAISGEDVHVVWNDWRDGYDAEIYYKLSQDEGISWEEDTRLTNDDFGYSRTPVIAVSGPVIHVVWNDDREWGVYNIYYKRSEDGGENWGADTLLSDGAWSAEDPSVAISGSSVHVVWNDFLDGNYEIYYKQNPTGNLIVGVENSLPPNSSQVVSIYPNPVSSILNISFNSQSDETITMRFMDISGKTFRTYNFTAVKGMNQYKINLEDFRNGLYFIGLTDGTNRIFKKVVINK